MRIKGKHGFYVSGKIHRSRTHHNPKEFNGAIDRLTKSNPNSLTTVDDLLFIVSESMEDGSVDTEEFMKVKLITMIWKDI